MRIPPECDLTDRGGTKREATELVNPQIWWHGCYKQARGAGDALSSARSTGHPAKMSPDLLQRIRRFAEERGWYKPGDTILDNFYGVGTTGLLRLQGYNVIGVELEAKFVEMAEENRAILDSKGPWVRRLGWGKVIQGDSRKLRELLGIQAEAAVTSPPYGDSLDSASHGIDWEKCDPKWGKVTTPGRLRSRETVARGYHYGEAEGQIGSLPDAAVTSPPWGEQSHYQIYDESKGFHSYDENEAKNRMKRDYIAGESEGQIGNLPDAAVTSPPYGQVMQRNKPEHPNIQRADDEMKKLRMGQVEYGKSKEQIGSLPDAAVTSPPYTSRMDGGCTRDGYSHIKPYDHNGRPEDYRKRWPRERDAQNIGNLADAAVTSPPWVVQSGGMATEGLPDNGLIQRHGGGIQKGLGLSDGQIQNLPDAAITSRQERETYQSAMFLCYQELHRCLKPGGVACVVTKNPTRKNSRTGKSELRRLDIDTATLLLMAGFELWCSICEDWDSYIHDHPDPDLEPVTGYRAVLAQEHRQPTLFGQTETFLKGRTSFFKRLLWRKGSPIALWEDVLFARA